MTTARNLASFGGIVGGLVGELKMWPTTSAPSGYSSSGSLRLSRSADRARHRAKARRHADPFQGNGRSRSP